MKHVVYSCNDYYIEQTLISMVSLLKYNIGPFQIWVVSDHISEENEALLKEKAALYQAECCFLDADEVLEGITLSGKTRHPRTIYAKLFLEYMIPAERALYLDSDTVIGKGLDALWDRDMEDELVAGVQMPYSPSLKEKLGIDADAPYLCDGVVLIHLELWRKMHIGERCRAYIRQKNGAPQMLSEETLNVVCQGKVGVLEPKYNLMASMIIYTAKQICQLFRADAYYEESELAEAKHAPVVVHYLNELFNRPWLESCDHPYKELYRNERRELFGEKPYIQQELSKHTQRTRKMQKILPFWMFAAIYHLKHKE